MRVDGCGVGQMPEEFNPNSQLSLDEERCIGAACGSARCLLEDEETAMMMGWMVWRDGWSGWWWWSLYQRLPVMKDRSIHAPPQLACRDHPSALLLIKSTCR